MRERAGRDYRDMARPEEDVVSSVYWTLIGYVYLPDFMELMKSLLLEWSDSNILATAFVPYVQLPPSYSFPHKEHSTIRSLAPTSPT